jgi:hypothetical protein
MLMKFNEISFLLLVSVVLLSAYFFVVFSCKVLMKKSCDRANEFNNNSNDEDARKRKK